MKLLSIELENFRQYAGRQRVTFAQDPKRNVTMFYGTNGSGKTTLLNAFTWALYEELSDDLEEDERLITDRVWLAASPDTRITVAVTVEFEHDDDVYTVRREATAEKKSVDQRLAAPRLTMKKRSPNGTTTDVEGPTSKIEQILPPRLSKFFFVNGERIEQLVRREAYTGIQDAIKTLLGLEQLERALRHVPQAAQHIRHQLKSDGASANKAEQLTADVDAIGLQLDELKARRIEIRDEIQHAEDEIATLGARLKGMEGAKKLQEQRENLELLRDAAKSTRGSLSDQRSQSLASTGYLAFLGDLPERIENICEALRLRGDLPAPLKETFIDDLLESGICICGTHLAAGSPAVESIESWRKRAGVAAVEGAWNQLYGTFKTVADQRSAAVDTLNAGDAQIAETEASIRSLEEQISDLTAKLKDLPNKEDVGKVETKREEQEARRLDLARQEGAAEGRIADLETARRSKEKEIERLQARNAANRVKLQRIAVAREVEEALTQILHLSADATRRRLDSTIRDLFERVSLKNYRPELNKLFQLELWQDFADERVHAPKSTGENMLLALSFVAAIAEESRRAGLGNGGSLVAPTGGEFPVVMDAAFGNLDDDYRRQVAEFLPRLTPQIVVFTSRAQATGPVEEQLRDFVGKQYVITVHSTKADIEDVTETISLEGRKYPYQVINSDRDGAEFTEVVR